MSHGTRLIALIGLLLAVAVTQTAYAKPKARGRAAQARAEEAKAAAEATEQAPEAVEAPAVESAPAELPPAEPAQGSPAAAPAETVTLQPPPSAASAQPAVSVAPAAPAAEATAALRAEVTTLMDDLATARAKAAVLGKALFKTRIVVRVQNLAGSDLRLGRLLVLLDGAAVFRGDGSSLTGDEARQVFEGFVAPGPHVVTIECEQRMRDDDAYGYTLRESYRVKAPQDRETDLLLVLDDDSSDAQDMAEDGEGEYDVRTRLRQSTRELKAR